MKRRLRLAGFGLVSVTWLSVQIACSRRPEPLNKPAVAQSPVSGQSPATGQSPSTQSENYPNLVAQAQEVNEALGRRDFPRIVALTYPKVIEAAGGRDKMVSELAKGMKEMEAEGVIVLSSTVGAPTQIIHVAGSVYAVLPTTLKVKAQVGVFQTEGTMIGISSDGGANWTFIDAGGKVRNQLTRLLPDAADKLNIPPEKQPEKISDN